MIQELREKYGKVAYEAYKQWLSTMNDERYKPWQELAESTREGYRVQAEAVATAFVDDLHPKVKEALLGAYA